MKVVELFWDASSPYTYLAHTQMPAFRARTGAEVRYRPFLLGGVFKATDNIAPGANPFKAAYLIQDLRRWRAHYKIAMKMPVEDVIFPLNSVLPMRVAVAADRTGLGQRAADAILGAYWADGINVSEPAAIHEVLIKAGLDGAALVAAAGTQDIKDQLRANTEEAVRRGAFGAPTFFVGDQLFWGNDRIELLEAHLGE